MDIESVAAKYHKNERTRRRHFNNFKDRAPLKTLPFKHINLVIDTTYFGRSFGYMIFRAHGVNLYHQQVQSETVDRLAFGLNVLDKLGYTYKSITIDGRTGFINYLKTRYPNTPLQYCQFHQKMTIKRYLTNNPKTPCGLELQGFMKDFMAHDYDSFSKDFFCFKKQMVGVFKRAKRSQGF